MSVAGVAILGYGVVGAGTARLLTAGRAGMADRTGVSPELLHIVDIRTFPQDPLEPLVTADYDAVLADPRVRVVVETIGGTGAAFAFSKRALASGRHVVTSNKELVAEHGPELLELAASHGVRYLFEASVGGGIPIIHPMRHCLAANEIHTVSGILNGTTNYILTHMDQDDMSFAAALSEAQAHGFAEQRPEADIEGLDAGRKLAILSSLAFGVAVPWREIHTEGIAAIDAAGIDTAAQAGAQVKLFARASRMADGRIAASVQPVALSCTHPVCCASGVNNAIAVEGDAIGTAMFYGPGAGALPTASAVVSDVLECLGGEDSLPRLVWPPMPAGRMVPFEAQPVLVLGMRTAKPEKDLGAVLAAAGYGGRPLGDGKEVLVFGEDGTLTEGILAGAAAACGGLPSGWIRFVRGS
jgi:homoserine dehydrogenase